MAERGIEGVPFDCATRRGWTNELSTRSCEHEYYHRRTCSLTFQTLLARPFSFMTRSNTIIGVSAPLPDLDANTLAAPARKAYPPSKMIDSLAFACALSLSPSLSMMPPVDMNAENAWRSVGTSIAPEDPLVEDASGELDWRGPALRVMIRGKSGGIALSVAFVKCWLEVRRHALSRLSTVSTSSI